MYTANNHVVSYVRDDGVVCSRSIRDNSADLERERRRLKRQGSVLQKSDMPPPKLSRVCDSVATVASVPSRVHVTIASRFKHCTAVAKAKARARANAFNSEQDARGMAVWRERRDVTNMTQPPVSGTMRYNALRSRILNRSMG